MTLKFQSRYVILRNFDLSTEREVKNAHGSIVYESKSSWSPSKLVHFQRALEYQCSKISSKKSLLISPGVKKKKTFLSLISIRPSNNLSLLYLKLLNMSTFTSSTVNPTSIPTSKMLPFPCVPSPYHTAPPNMFLSPPSPCPNPLCIYTPLPKPVLIFSTPEFPKIT